MSESDAQCFNDSLERCIGGGRFIDRFYERFIASSSDVREKFKNSDMRRQRRMMSASLYMTMLVADSQPEGLLHLERLAVLHGKGDRDIPPRLYDLLLECMLETVTECDPKYEPEIGRVWRRTMEPGIAFMKARYDADTPPGSTPHQAP